MMNLYEMQLTNVSSGQKVHKLLLLSPENSITKGCCIRLLMEDFPCPDFECDGFFFGVIREHIRCKDAARRVYLKPADSAVPITEFFSEFLVAENYMIEKYGTDFNKLYSLVYVEYHPKEE